MTKSEASAVCKGQTPNKPHRETRQPPKGRPRRNVVPPTEQDLALTTKGEAPLKQTKGTKRKANALTPPPPVDPESFSSAEEGDDSDYVPSENDSYSSWGSGVSDADNGTETGTDTETFSDSDSDE